MELVWWFLVKSQVFRCFSRSFGIVPRAPITTGTSLAFFSQSRSTLILRPRYFVIFSTSFCWILLSPGIATQWATPAFSQPLWCLVCRVPNVYYFESWNPTVFWRPPSVWLFRLCVQTICPAQVCYIFCTDSSIAFRPLFYVALYSLSVQSRCKRWLDDQLILLSLFTIGTFYHPLISFFSS